MSFATYNLVASADHLSFEFYSDGPKGPIKKIIHYTKLKVTEAPDFDVYNLGFGDLNQTTGEIDDLRISDNHDRDKVLKTVANSVLHFFDKYPTARVAFRGSTPARTRLYIMEISRNWNEVKKGVLVEGLTLDGWESFQKNRHYSALLITRKKS